MIEVYKKLNVPTEKDYNLEKFEDNFYIGKDKNENPTIIIVSENQKTKASRKLGAIKFRLKQKMPIENEKKTVNIITLTISDDEKSIADFFNLVYERKNERDLLKAFSGLAKIFNNKKSNYKDIKAQGLFAELYVIKYFDKMGISIADFYQVDDTQTFDFSFTEQKKLEVKSTAKEERIHKFKHEQLTDPLHKIMVASVMVREDDRGLSLNELLEETSTRFPGLSDFIDNAIMNFSDKDLEKKYSESYINEKLKFYKAEDIPHIDQTLPKGVTGVHYNSDLSVCEEMKEKEVIEFIQG